MLLCRAKYVLRSIVEVFLLIDCVTKLTTFHWTGQTKTIPPVFFVAIAVISIPQIQIRKSWESISFVQKPPIMWTTFLWLASPRGFPNLTALDYQYPLYYFYIYKSSLYQLMCWVQHRKIPYICKIRFQTIVNITENLWIVPFSNWRVWFSSVLYCQT